MPRWALQNRAKFSRSCCLSGEESSLRREVASHTNIGWGECKKVGALPRAWKLAQCEQESDESLRLLALQEEEEEPAHYKLLPLYEGYLEHRKIRLQKSLIATRAGPRAALIMAVAKPCWSVSRVGSSHDLCWSWSIGVGSYSVLINGGQSGLMRWLRAYHGD